MSHSNPDGTVGTRNCAILQDVTTTVYSRLCLLGSEYQLTRQLDGRTINDFDLYLTNSLHQLLPADHCKDFECVLEFTTIDENDDINEQAAIRALDHLGFQRRHGCGAYFLFRCIGASNVTRHPCQTR